VAKAAKIRCHFKRVWEVLPNRGDIVSTPERQQDADPAKGTGYGANDQPDTKGAEELEERRQSELAGQRASEEIPDTSATSDPDDPSPSPGDRQRSNADEAKDNERQAKKEGRELPG
jgi:hypothetical protein